MQIQHNIEAIRQDIFQAEQAIYQSLSPETRDQDFRMWVSLTFSGLIAILLFSFFWIIYQRSDKSSELAAILSAISGYILGKGGEGFSDILKNKKIIATIRNAIKSFDNADGKLEEQKEEVRALELLGSAKAEIFIRDIQTSLLTAGEEKSSKTVPVTFMVGSKKKIRAFSSSETKNIGNVVTESLSAFLSGNKETIINGVGRLACNVLGIFLGEGSASSDTIEMYYVATDGLSPVRVDMED